MKLSLALGSLLLASLIAQPKCLAIGELEEGDQTPNMCWQDASDKEFCLYDGAKEKALVLIYTTPSCESCVEAMPGLVDLYGKVKEKGVSFVNLVSEGEKEGELPSADVLKSWAERLKIPFLVGASPEDGGTVFFAQPKPPIVAVADKSKNHSLVYKSETINLEEIAAAIEDALHPEPDDH